MSRKKPKPFTNGELAQLVNLRERVGASFGEIGRHLDRHSGTVTKAYYKHKNSLLESMFDRQCIQEQFLFFRTDSHFTSSRHSYRIKCCCCLLNPSKPDMDR